MIHARGINTAERQETMKKKEKEEKGKSWIVLPPPYSVFIHKTSRRSTTGTHLGTFLHSARTKEAIGHVGILAEDSHAYGLRRSTSRRAKVQDT